MTPDRSCPPLDDLDRVAERYAIDRQGLDEDQAARLRSEVTTALLPFAGRLSRRYRSSSEPAEDLEQVARLGLVKAVDRYDPERGSFTAFAVSTISGELKRYFRDHTWGVHVPRRVQNLSLAVSRAEEDLTTELGRQPTDGELERRCGSAADEVRDARQSRAGYRPASLNAPLSDDGGELGDLLGHEDRAVELVADVLTVRELIDKLPARERRIVLDRFYGGRTQADIAADLGISQMHVSRLLARTLGWLRAAMLSDVPPPRPFGEPDVMETGPVITARRLPGGRTRVFISGEVDRDNAGRLRTVVLEVVRRSAAGSHVEIHLGGVPLMDAAGVAALLAVGKSAHDRRIGVSVTGLQPFVQRIAVVAGLGPMLAAGIKPGTAAGDGSIRAATG
jgi:RNA polymerase sigma-B factor